MQIRALIALGLLLPLLGTALGAAAVLLPHRRSDAAQRVMSGFSAGVMLAASVWSLLLPAMEFSARGSVPPWLSATAGFLLGAALVPLLHKALGAEDGLLFWSVTLHNIPEGMAVGVSFAAVLAGDAGAMAAALALSFGIAVQNVPEGGVISLPLALGGMKKSRACALGVLSGAVEPVFAALAMLLAAEVTALLPWVLAMAAGCMYFVSLESLIPSAAKETAGSAAAVAGFALMMLLDVLFG